MHTHTHANFMSPKTDLSENPFQGEDIHKLRFQCLHLDGQKQRILERMIQTTTFAS